MATLLLLLVAGASLFGAWRWFEAAIAAPGPMTRPTLVLVPKGEGVEEIGLRLAAAGLVRDARLVAGAMLVHGGQRSLKAGEYEIPAGASILDILALLQSGRTHVRRITLAEGLSVAQIYAALEAAEGLEGALPPRPPEGSLLPETYHYSRGESRAALVQRARKAMDEALSQAWAQRSPETAPLGDRMALLILASVVEKETGVEAERARIAGVFLNRLKRGMRLQSDPTVIYALTKGEAPLGRALTRADLTRPDPFNTYTSDGLPPTPIANPGRASLLAVAKPMATKDLYFVADGNGGHAFAETLDQHNRNVARWRQIQKERGEP